MTGQHNCVLCACNNPLLKIMEKYIGDESVTRKLAAGYTMAEALEPASLVIRGGTIYPLEDGGTETVEAIGIHGGKVIAAGSLYEVEQAMAGYDFSTRILEVGETLLPGLIEPHVHVVMTALMRGWIDFGPFAGQYLRENYSPKWLKDAVKQHIPDDKCRWILGMMVDPSLMSPSDKKNGTLNQLVTFNAHFMDEVVKDVPLFLLAASLHTAYVNTLALQRIYDGSETVQVQYDTFDAYLKATNGVLQEVSGITPALEAIPTSQLLEMATSSFNHLSELFTEAASRGVTLLYDAGMTPEMEGLLKLYMLFHHKAPRIGFARICEDLESARELPEHQKLTEYKDLYQGNVKLVSDGSNQGLTGYQAEPYSVEPADNLGAFNFPPNSQPGSLAETGEFLPMIKTIMEKGWPLMIHANGDRAIDFTIEAYATCLNGTSGLEKRHRVEHCSLLSDANLKRIKDLGLSPSFLIGHVGYWGYVFREIIFKEKAEMLDLCKSMLDEGVRISLHSDNSVTPLGPLRMMEQAITRQMEASEDKSVLNPDQTLTAEQALRAVTTDAAWQCHADAWLGSLTPDRFADFVILSEDPLTRECSVGMRDICVVETWKGGVCIHQNDV